MSPPRLHVLPAADVAVVIRRGPSRWWHILRWRLDPPEVESGAWFGGRLYPRRCAVSADGSLLGYYAMAAGKPPPWDSYLAVSKMPWLHALAAWHWGSTWHWGCEFLSDGRFCTGEAEPTPPDVGSYPAGLAARPPLPVISHPDGWRARDVQAELRRGWVQAAATDAETSAAAPLVLRRPRPGDDDVALLLVHGGHDFTRHGVEGADIRYLIERGGSTAELSDAAWADWDARGRLLVASAGGELRVVEVTPAGLEAVWRHDLSSLEPAPVRAPEWARRW